ncbi:iron-containing alcohol dehydrogenase [Pseudomonas fulva]|jgi:alcohol dehydrogenase|uniref:Iron-containing alcohol dehydrogenase n=1 Tax=Pseudomonas putida TaxID=303 RepID=A0AAW6PPU8_PSEPU|nr:MULTISPECIES: iron-containing alcohol dehydrogenase [Pseudomonas]AXQ48164.1 iron-containing alcohol dehydrogenase [Stenotrophomonas rhizophila]PPB16919.1 alcohol dehydrogenase [Pseudomonas aeruginosa]AGN82189.1 iron-dependent family alcohol dehydrogenase [Pseudomonas putida H8234]EGB98496.1 alcohol dehydrogenase [Pseudomonas sp. TJI-51]MBA1219250.1 iron-containing alcohol dehydrogenase [Pseudomonas fulva]
MSVSAFQIANKLLTGASAVEQLDAELTRLKVDNPLIVTDAILVKSGTVDLALVHLGGRSYGLYDQVQPEPEISLVEDCTRAFREGGHDGLIGLGGGSAMDIAKGVAAFARHDGPLAELFGVDQVSRKGPPLIAIPTTAGTGSEVTNVAIFSDKNAQLKKGIVSNYLLPDVALVSPIMTRTCPRSVTAASGVDALVHAIEAYISINRSPITDAIALGAIKVIARALPKAYANPNDLLAREDMATASLMAGMAFGNAGVGAVHALAYPLGGRFNIAHGVSNALLLPYVMRWNKLACMERLRDVAQAMGVNIAGLSDSQAADASVDAMIELCAAVDIPAGLRAFNVPQDALAPMAEEASKIDRLMRNNPRKLTSEDIESIYQAAW